MNICLFGISGIPLGKHNVKDPRLDEADRLVEAKKKVYVQVDVVGDDAVADADVIVVSEASRVDLILRDLEFIETRLGRGPGEAEKAVLEKLSARLEGEGLIADAGLTAEEAQTIAVHTRWLTSKPVVLATEAEMVEPDTLVRRAFEASGHISFLTVGGKENRAWQITRGTTAWEAAGAIHTDIQKGFIRAEIISWEDFTAAGGEAEAKRANKLRLETKTYVIQDYDLVNFRFNK
jgi:hypothetical protein